MGYVVGVVRWVSIVIQVAGILATVVGCAGFVWEWWPLQGPGMTGSSSVVRVHVAGVPEALRDAHTPSQPPPLQYSVSVEDGVLGIFAGLGLIVAGRSLARLTQNPLAAKATET